MEYRGYVHKERRDAGVWIGIFGQVENGDRTVVEMMARQTQFSAFSWAIEKVREAYDSISIVPGKTNDYAVKLPRHCLWCGRLLRYEPAGSAYCAGHKGKARKNRIRLPYKAIGCWTPNKAAYLHRGTSIMVARLLELDCYQCTRDDGRFGCNGFHLTSSERGGIIAHLNTSRENN